MRVRFARHRAFTLIEVLVVLVLAGIMMAMAVPSFQDIYRKRLFAQNVEEFRLFLLEARSMAIREKSEVLVCLLDTAGTGCNSVTTWDLLSRNRQNLGIFVMKTGLPMELRKVMSFRGIESIYFPTNATSPPGNKAQLPYWMRIGEGGRPPGIRYRSSGDLFSPASRYFTAIFAVDSGSNYSSSWGEYREYKTILESPTLSSGRRCWCELVYDYSGRATPVFWNIQGEGAPGNLNLMLRSFC